MTVSGQPSAVNRQWQTVLFIDLDATIIRGPFEPAVFPTVFAELAQKSGLDKQELRRMALQDNLARYRDPSVPADRAMDWDDIFAAIASRLGVTLEVRAVEIARAHAGPPASAVLDGAREALEQLACPSRALVVATQGLMKYQKPVLDALGLTPLFTGLLAPDVNHAPKISRAFYGDWPQAAPLCISVGDYYEHDVIPAKQWGWKSIWKLNHDGETITQLDPFARPTRYAFAPDQTARPDAIILSLRELPAVVEQIESRSNA